MRLLVTGSGGFVGSRFLATLAESTPEWPVRCLSRKPDRVRDRLPPAAAHWAYLTHDLARDPIPVEWLADIECVVHLAAATGRANHQTYDAVNRQGTARLALACKQAGVRRFVLVSSVAAGFGDTRYYPYAWSKRAAEEAVKETAIQAIVMRPTMIFGPGSAVAAGFRGLAGGPALLLPGRCTHAVQPVGVADVVRAIRQAVEPTTGPGLYGVGGPECLSMRELLERLRHALGKAPGPILPMPLGPLRSALGMMERFIGPRLPVTAGQLASFANPATVLDLPRLAKPTVDLDTMIAESFPNE